MKYPSALSPNKLLTPVQYIVEKTCIKNASQTGREIAIGFAKLPNWKSFYGMQLKRAKILLENFSCEAIIKALDDPKCRKVYSLYCPWLPEVIRAHESKINTQEQLKINTSKEERPEMGGTEFKRKSFKNKKNIIEELDG